MSDTRAPGRGTGAVTGPLTAVQRESVAWLLDHPRGLLLGGMGSGKTRTALCALRSLGPDALPALVLAPATVSEATWTDEAERIGSPLHVEAMPRTPAAARREALSGPADVRVLSTPSVKDALQTRWRTVVVDEASQYATPGTQRERALRRIAERAERVWLLTGTPGHDPIRLWTLARILDGGRRLGALVTDARDRYLTEGVRLPSGARIGREPRPGALDSITAAMAPLTRVVPADGRLALPGLTVVEHPCPLGERAAAATRSLRRDGLAVVDGVEVVPASAGVAAQAVVQLASGALWEPGTDGARLLLPDRGAPDPRPSVTAALDAAGDMLSRRSGGVLVEHWWRHETPALIEGARSRGWSTGDAASRADRERWDAGDVDVLVAHPASTGHGLNLQRGGSSVVWASLPWSRELWDQACARLARPGQDAGDVEVRVVLPHPPGHPSGRTVVHDVLDTLRERGDVQEAVTRGLSGDDGSPWRPASNRS